MTDMLAEMLRMQDELEHLTTGSFFSQLSRDGGFEGEVREERVKQYKEMFIAGIREAVEQLDEMGSKPWASSRHWNDAAVKKEVVDEWHFLLAKTLLAGFTAEELYEAYKAKWEVNVGRQNEGYDGVSTKCPKCKRALDDPSTRCKVFDEVPRTHINDGWCIDVPGGYYINYSEEVNPHGSQR